jgi:cell wall-associated NlpC family hydrolase
MLALEREQRDRVDEVAISWIGTPYHHHNHVKHVGVDCAHLLIAVYAEAGLIEDFDPGYYPSQFFMHSKEERFLKIVEQYAHEVDRPEVGDVVIYRMGHVYAHGAIVVKPAWPAIIHAHARFKFVARDDGASGALSKPMRRPRFFSRW